VTDFGGFEHAQLPFKIVKTNGSHESMLGKTAIRCDGSIEQA